MLESSRAGREFVGVDMHVHDVIASSQTSSQAGTSQILTNTGTYWSKEAEQTALTTPLQATAASDHPQWLRITLNANSGASVNNLADHLSVGLGEIRTLILDPL